MSVKNKNQGFTLIEVIIYIALFSILITMGFVTAYQLIEGADDLNIKAVTQEEGNFVLRKIGWVLTGMTKESDIRIPTFGTSNKLRIMKAGAQYDVCRDGIKLKIRKGVEFDDVPCDFGTYNILTTDNVTVDDLEFRFFPSSGTRPAGISATTTINGVDFAITKYIRK